MSQSGNACVVVIGASDGPEAALARECLARRGWTATEWIRPRDADDLTRHVEAQGDVAVIFATFSIYLDTLWSRRISAATWARAHVLCADLTDAGIETIPGRLHVEWERHTRTLIARQRLATLVLTVVLLAATAAVVWLG